MRNHSIVEAAKHSLQVVVEEFKKICKPEISKLKGGYSANTTLIFNSWLKDIDMCVHNHNLIEHKAVQLVKDFATEHVNGAVEIYLHTNEEWSHSKLIEYLQTFESCKTLIPSVIFMDDIRNERRLKTNLPMSYRSL